MAKKGVSTQYSTIPVSGPEGYPDLPAAGADLGQSSGKVRAKYQDGDHSAEKDIANVDGLGTK